MTYHDLMLEEFLKRQTAAKRVLVAIKKARTRETLPSVLQVADAPLAISEDHSFYVFRTDTNAVLARGIQGFEAAKTRANELRKHHGLKWDQVAFKKESKPTGAKSASGAPSSRTRSTPIRYDRSSGYNPSKRGHFRGYYGTDGSYHDID